MKKDKAKEHIETRIAEVRGMDDWELESELSADFGGNRSAIAEWIRDFAERELVRLRDWVDKAED